MARSRTPSAVRVSGAAEQRLDLRLGQLLRQAARLLRRTHAQRRILGDRAAIELEPVEPPQRGQPARDRRRLRFGLELVGEPLIELAAVDRQQRAPAGLATR